MEYGGVIVDFEWIKVIQLKPGSYTVDILTMEGMMISRFKVYISDSKYDAGWVERIQNYTSNCDNPEIKTDRGYLFMKKSHEDQTRKYIINFSPL